MASLNFIDTDIKDMVKLPNVKDIQHKHLKISALRSKVDSLGNSKAFSGISGVNAFLGDEALRDSHEPKNIRFSNRKVKLA